MSVIIAATIPVLILISTLKRCRLSKLKLEIVF